MCLEISLILIRQIVLTGWSRRHISTFRLIVSISVSKNLTSTVSTHRFAGCVQEAHKEVSTGSVFSDE